MRNSSKEPKQRVCNRSPPTLGLCTTGRMMVLLLNSLLDAWRSLPIPTTTSTSLLPWPHQVPLHFSALLQETQHHSHQVPLHFSILLQETHHCPMQMLQASTTITFSPTLACMALTFKLHWTSIGTMSCACCVRVLPHVRT